MRSLEKSWALRNLFRHSNLTLSFCQKGRDPVGPWSFPTALRNISLTTCLGAALDIQFPAWEIDFLIDDNWQLELQLFLDITGTWAQGTALARPLEKKTEIIEGLMYCFLSMCRTMRSNLCCILWCVKWPLKGSCWHNSNNSMGTCGRQNSKDGSVRHLFPGY